MLLAAHQPNFIPWISFFDKMNKADVFVILVNCQFEKNSWQNRCSVWGKYWTNPVSKGTSLIKDKKYRNGEDLFQVNMLWITAIAKTLGIDTSKIHIDYETNAVGTDRIIELCKFYNCNKYLTNPESIDKYLDEGLMNKAGIEIVDHEPLSDKHVFEMFDECGIDRTSYLLKRSKSKCVI